MRVRHQGETIIKEITLRCQLPGSLVVQQATGGHRRLQNTINLDIVQLAPGEQAELEVRVIAPRGAPAAPLAGFLLVANQLVDSTTIQVAAVAAEPVPADPETPGHDRLTVSIMDLDDPVTVGQKINYQVNIRNDRDVSDKYIRVRVELPEGMELVRFIQPHQGEATMDATSRIIQATEIRELLPREQLKPIRVEVVARRSGQFHVQVSVESARSDNVQQAEEETTVSPDP